MLIGYVRVSKSDGTQTLAPQRDAMLAFTDKRIILVNQLLAGMKALKTYAWEAAQEASRQGLSVFHCSIIVGFVSGTGLGIGGNIADIID